MQTIYDVAARAGVSIATVSLVLNHPERVRESTRKNVERVLREMNYAPNAMARGLANKHSQAIGVLSNDFRHVTFADIAYTLESLFSEWGFSSILCNTGYDIEKKKKYIRTLAEKKVAAVVLIGSVFNSREIEHMITDWLPTTPVVLANGALAIPNAYSVLVDHAHGLELAVDHLTRRGCKDILFAYQFPSFNSMRKVSGFQSAMQQRGLPLENAVWEAGAGFERGMEFVDRVIAAGKKFSAIIYGDDLPALGVMKRLKQLGMRVPEDVAVIGYDNSLFARSADPSLTSIDIKAETFASIVANVVHDLLGKRQVGSQIIVRPELVVRESA